MAMVLTTAACGADVFLPDLWYDATTNLLWQRGESGDKLDPPEAESYCAGLSIEGRDGFRLPTIDELKSLLRDCNLSGCGVSTSCTDSSTQGPCFDFDTCDADSCYEGEGPGVDGCYLEPALAGGCGDRLWSSTAAGVSFSDGYHWTLSFSSPEIDYISDTGRWGKARCVRVGED